MANVNVKNLDTEPLYSKEEPATQLEVIEALNWYQTHKTEKDAAKYLGVDLKYAKNHITHAWITRMKQRGFILNESNEQMAADLKTRFDNSKISKTKVAEIDEEGNVISAPVVVNLQERISAKTDVYIGELEGMIDEYGYGSKEFNAYDWFVKNEVKPIHATKISEYFTNRAAQFVKEVEDKHTREGYVKLGKVKIKSILAVMAAIVKDAQRLSQNVGKTRKPRKKKAVNFEKMAAKVQFKIRDDAFKIQSIPPVNIIGASQLWLFNTKTKRLAVYNAEDASGLFLKGSKIIGYSADKSFAKTLRKPEKVLNNVLNGGKLVLRKIMDEVAGKNYPLNGKINKDTVILRAMK
jgi:hypothetical protein